MHALVSRPQTKRESFHRRNSLPFLSVPAPSTRGASVRNAAKDTSLTGFRATTYVEQLLHNAPQSVKDSIRNAVNRRQSLQPSSLVSDKSLLGVSVSEATIEARSRSIAIDACIPALSPENPKNDTSGFMHRRKSVSDSATASSALKLATLALIRSSAMNSRAPSQEDSLSSSVSEEAQVAAHTSTVSQTKYLPDFGQGSRASISVVVTEVIRRRNCAPRSWCTPPLVRHDTLKLEGKSERTWERDSLRTNSGPSALLGAATLDTGLTL
ncbi:hypothetical protein T484DRAFT_1932234, partial [Baffinella frigidus]